MASSTTSFDWNTISSASSLVFINTHSLYLSISGPPSKPLIIILVGAGDISASWEPLKQLVSPSFRILLYDRSGLGRSNPRPYVKSTPRPPVAVTAAEELRVILETTGLAPPYVLCAHSYGAIIAREFLNLWPRDVVGMVLVEGATERQCQYFKLPDLNIQAVMGNLNFARVTGLREEAKLGKEEWRERAKLMFGGMDAAMEETHAFIEVCETLGAKKQIEGRVLGDKPLSVIRANGKRDYERIYQAGIEAGNGTTEQRKAFRDLLDRWDDIDKELKEEQLQISRNSRLVYVSDCGHNVQLLRPGVVAKEIQWVMDSLPRKLTGGSL